MKNVAIMFRSTFLLYHPNVPEEEVWPRNRVSRIKAVDLLNASESSMKWRLFENEEPRLLFEKYAPVLQGEVDLPAPLVDCIAADSLLSRAVMTYYDYGISTLCFETSLDGETFETAAALKSRFETYQNEMWVLFTGSNLLLPRTGFLGARAVDAILQRTIWPKDCCRRNPLANEGAARMGSTYADTLVINGPIDPDMCKTLDLQSEPGTGRKAHTNANFDYCAIASEDTTVLRIHTHLIDFALLTSVAMSDIARRTRKELKAIQTSGHVVDAQTEAAVRKLRQLFQLLHLDSLPYSVVGWAGEEAFYKRIFTVWRLDELQQIAGEATAAATHEILDIVRAEQTRSEKRITRIISLISMIALIGLFAQLTDFVYSSNAPGGEARIVSLSLFAVFVIALICFFTRRKR